MKTQMIMFAVLLCCHLTSAQSLQPKAVVAQAGYTITGNVSLSWTMAETFNSALSSGAYMLTQGNQQPVVPSVPARALDLDGINDYVSVADNPSLNFGTGDFTVEAYIKAASSQPSFPAILSKRTVAEYDGFLLFLWSDGRLAAQLQGNNFPSNSANLRDDQWHHVSITRTASFLSFFVDGAQVGQYSIGAYNVSTSHALWMGWDEGNQGQTRLKGSIDEIRIWNRQLCQGELQNNMGCELGGSEPGLVAYYRMNQGFANANNAGETTATDASGNGLTGTLHFFALTGATSNWVAPGAVGSTSCAPFVAPEINIKGNNQGIADGDASPTATDHTDFGNAVLLVPVTRTYTIENTGAAVLNISSINVTGTNATEFVVSGAPSAIAPATSATFDVTFTSTAIGTRYATVTINNDDCNESLYDFAVQGSATCSQPAFSQCPGNIVTNTATGLCVAPVQYSVAASGTPMPTYTYSFSGATSGSGSGDGSGNSFDKGVTNVEVTATNACGTAICSFTVTVADNEDPTLSCPANRIESTAATSCDAVVNNIDPIVTDNCGAIASYTLTGATTGSGTGSASGFIFNKGVTTVTYMATDASGNTSAPCSFTVKVVDNTPPVLTCPAPVVKCKGANGTYHTFTLVATDNCGAVNNNKVTYSMSGATAGSGTGKVLYANFSQGVTIITWTAKDAANNTSVCTTSITVNNCNQNARQLFPDDTNPFGEVQVYPNPNNGSFTVELPSAEGGTEIRVTDVQGKLIGRKVVAKEEGTIIGVDLGHVAAGMYFVEVVTAQQQYRSKIIVK